MPSQNASKALPVAPLSLDALTIIIKSKVPKWTLSTAVLTRRPQDVVLQTGGLLRHRATEGLTSFKLCNVPGTNQQHLSTSPGSSHAAMARNWLMYARKGLKTLDDDWQKNPQNA
ncbi:predicted protein [Verticillium alfalfae VaMs.102]|uniref:Predicted protein n=1 Tax=Verticillium alfalfae (strain VaMs.102 / ATCC MYA-4576 / FGSC 10136) TaxID=526221 RepID=C9SN52_VERA1|nr:predicted protein [Verticillium alfalfae VaMs.102]EEY20217.1 predicted protein [Verticillium alfalfae VaMs.102]